MLINNNYYLSEIFIEVLEKNGDKFGQEFVRRVRIYVKTPECAELLNFLVINAVGGRICIKRSVVDDAIECLKKYYEQEIEDNNSISDKEKTKSQMKAYMKMYHDLLVCYIESHFYLNKCCLL